MSVTFNTISFSYKTDSRTINKMSKAELRQVLRDNAEHHSLNSSQYDKHTIDKGHLVMWVTSVRDYLKEQHDEAERKAKFDRDSILADQQQWPHISRVYAEMGAMFEEPIASSRKLVEKFVADCTKGSGDQAYNVAYECRYRANDMIKAWEVINNCAGYAKFFMECSALMDKTAAEVKDIVEKCLDRDMRQVLDRPSLNSQEYIAKHEALTLSVRMLQHILKHFDDAVLTGNTSRIKDRWFSY